VPPDFWIEAARMGIALALVAGAAVPVGLLLRARARAALLPPWKPWPVPWNGFEVFAAFVGIAVLLPALALEVLNATNFYPRVYGPEFPAVGATELPDAVRREANTLRGLWANLFALPAALGCLWLALRSAYPTYRPLKPDRGSAALGVCAWLALAPLVLALNAIVNALAHESGLTPETHPLAKLGARPLFDRVLFAFEACVSAPVREEVLFRGLLLSWCVGRSRDRGLRSARPWIVMALAVGLAVVLGERRTGPTAFAVLLALLLGCVCALKKTGARRAQGVVATAALFAVVHSGVWPNPVALFVLGVGLGWLAVRTNGILVPVVVHGLFNAVSVVFVLRAV
jgi:membrane protease YdiL (CAAX protease family)